MRAEKKKGKPCRNPASSAGHTKSSIEVSPIGTEDLDVSKIALSPRSPEYSAIEYYTSGKSRCVVFATVMGVE